MSSSFSECSISSDTVPLTSAGSWKRVMRMLSMPLPSSLEVPKVLRTRCLPCLFVKVIVVCDTESWYLMDMKFFSMISSGVSACAGVGVPPRMNATPRAAIAGIAAGAMDFDFTEPPLKMNLGRNFRTSAGMIVSAAVTLTSMAVPMRSAFHVCG